jgi:hypothetical protein
MGNATAEAPAVLFTTFLPFSMDPMLGKLSLLPVEQLHI